MSRTFISSFRICYDEPSQLMKRGLAISIYPYAHSHICTRTDTHTHRYTRKSTFVHCTEVSMHSEMWKMINIKLPFQAYGVNSSIYFWGKKKKNNLGTETFHLGYCLKWFVLRNLWSSSQAIKSYEILLNPETIVNLLRDHG